MNSTQKHTTPTIARRIAILTAVLLIAALTLTGIAHAKMLPYVEPLDADWGGLDDPFTIPGSFFVGIYGRLTTADDLDVIALQFVEPEDNMNTSLLVPICGDDFVDFYPTLAVIGPGLDRPDDDTLADLPFDLDDLPEDVGLAIFPYPHVTTTQLTGRASGVPRPISDWRLFEQGHYAELTLILDIPQAGDYLFAIWSPADDDSPGVSGAYTLMTGAAHPAGSDFPRDPNMDAAFQMISDGSWIGQDCAG